MLIETLQKIYERDLSKLKEEIALYSIEADLWKTSGEITNSAGNLTLHLVGNLRHFFGAVLGETGYIRDRDKEFSDGGVSRGELLAGIDWAAADVRATLAKLTVEDLAATYPLEVFGHSMTTEFFVVHLATHLNYHLGQINYHRRMLAS
ncbi:MAG: DinB family protein [Pyrinomonadaceae bacterium]